MKRTSTTVTGLAALVAVLVIGMCSAGAAQAHTFLWTGALPSLFLALADGPQLFIPVPGGPGVICKHLRFHGTILAESQLTQTAIGEYSKCEAIGKPVTVTPAEYVFSADETIAITGKSILITVPGVCTFHFGPIITNRIRYLVDPNSGGTRLLTHVEAENLHVVILGGGGVCGPEGLHTEGTYRGLLLEWAHGSGTLSWS